MVLNFIEEKELEELKHTQRMDFEQLRHKNALSELEVQLEIAKETMVRK
jgi:hypothetical protein